MRRREKQDLEGIAIPSTANLERQLIAELVASPSEIREAAKVLNSVAFSDADMERAFVALCRMEEGGEPVDYITLGEKVGHDWVMNALVLDAPEINYGSAVIRHCFVLKEGYLRREAYKMAVRLLQQSAQPDADVEKIIGIIDDFKETVSEATETESTIPLEKAMLDLGDTLEETERQVTSGVPALDDTLYGGFAPGQLVILAARPSVGKTSVALYMAKKAGEAGKKAHVYSLEMTKEELAKRYLLAEGSINSWEIARRTFDWVVFHKVADSFVGSNVYINDSLRSCEAIVTEIIRQHRLGRLDIAFVDYLGLISDIARAAESKVHTIGQVTARFKELAMTLGVPIVLLSQLNRNSVMNGGKRSPQLADLRDSGSIEQDADVVLMLEPDRDIGEGYGDDTVTQKELLTMWVRKNRCGKREIGIRLLVNETHTDYDQYDIVTP